MLLFARFLTDFCGFSSQGVWRQGRRCIRSREGRKGTQSMSATRHMFSASPYRPTGSFWYVGAPVGGIALFIMFAPFQFSDAVAV